MYGLLRRLCGGLLAGGLLYAGLATATGADGTDQSKLRALVARMTLAEKIGQLQDQAPAIVRLGIPAYGWWSEGLHGLARNGEATVFPQAIGLAASWDPDLLSQVGRTTALEARAAIARRDPRQGYPRFGGLTIWSPNLNLFRDPRWGRGQETYGEDPLLTARLGVAYIQGLQGPDPQHPLALATPKHFDAHSGPEKIRHQFDARVSAHDLEDSYLPAFRAAIVQGRAGAIMCSYNALNGTPTCADPWLLQQTLRHDWGFTGTVVSDCDAVDDMTAFHHYTADDATASALAIQAGTDLDCGHAYAQLASAVSRGQLPVAVIDRAVLRLLSQRARLGLLQLDRAPPALPLPDLASRRALALQAAGESLVLLKNAGALLPLQGHPQLAVIGPTADLLADMEANYHGTARQVITPLQGLRQIFGAESIHYAQGSALANGISVPVPSTQLSDEQGRPGLAVEYFPNASMQGPPQAGPRASSLQLDLDHINPVQPQRPEAGYAIRWQGRLDFPVAGRYRLGLGVARCFDCRGHDRVRLLLDGKVLQDGRLDVADSPVEITRPGPHALRVELYHTGQDQGLVLRWQVPAGALWPQAQRAVQASDIIIAMLGLSQDMEGEQLQTSTAGFDHGDRVSLGLPAPQEQLLRRLVASGKPVVLVNLSGGGVALDWASTHVAAIIQAWYPGEQGGLALAEVLSGRRNPSGRLPITIYRDAAQLPPYQDYAMAGRTYRYFKGRPLYPFGAGLSYSHFVLSAVQWPARLAAGQPLRLSVQIANRSARAGDDVVQVYLRPPASPDHPRWMLVGFQRVHLAGGSHTRLNFELPPRALSLVDSAGHRAVEAGRYQWLLSDHGPDPVAQPQGRMQIVGRQPLPH